jgi:hypothetical protein
MVNFLPSFTMHERDITMGLYDEIFWSEEQPVVPRKDFYNAGMAVIKLAEDTAFGIVMKIPQKLKKEKHNAIN